MMDKDNIYFALLWIFCFVCFGYWFTSAAEFSPTPVYASNERHYQDLNNFNLTT